MKPQFPILFLLASMGAFVSALITPALPAIQSFFHVSQGMAQLTISISLIGYCIGQLLYGPLANRHGRKKALYIGIPFCIFGSLLCALSGPMESFSMLLFARFVQGVGSSVGLTISFTMIGDVYGQVESSKLISRLLIAFGIMPGVGSTIGGWLTQYCGWESCFYFLALFTALILWLSVYLPETAHSLEHGALSLSNMVKAYAIKLKNRRLICCSLIVGCGTAILYIFAAKSPFIGINLIGLDPHQFGTLNLIPPLGLLLGSYVGTKLAGRFQLFNILLGGIIASFATTLMMLIPFSLGMVNTWTLFLPMFLIQFTECIVYANSASLGIATAKNKSNASALLNFINIFVTLIALFVAELFFPVSVIALPLSFLFLFFLILIFWYILKRTSKGNFTTERTENTE